MCQEFRVLRPVKSSQQETSCRPASSLDAGWKRALLQSRPHDPSSSVSSRPLTDRMSRQVVGTTGRRPDDPAGQRRRRASLGQLITLPELEELLDVTIANYHFDRVHPLESPVLPRLFNNCSIFVQNRL
jgi:hypothetical protein